MERERFCVAQPKGAVCVSYVRETGVNMTELGPNMSGSPSRAGHRASYPPGDTRLAPHSGPPGLRRPAPLRTTKTTTRPDHHDPAAQLHLRAPCPVRLQAAAPRYFRAPVIPAAQPLGDCHSPAPQIPLSALRGERACPGRDPGVGVRACPGRDPGRGSPARTREPTPYAAVTAQAPRCRGANTHPEN